jgi:hypothetical protein
LINQNYPSRVSRAPPKLRRARQVHGILKSKNMVRAFFSQIKPFFHADWHFKIKLSGVVPQPKRDIAFNATSASQTAQHRRSPIGILSALDTLRHKLNARRRSRGAKSGDPFDANSSGDERDGARISTYGR